MPCLAWPSALVLTMVSVSSMIAAEPEVWRYVDRSEDVRPVFRPIPLTAGRSPDVKERVEYRGIRRKYAQLRYGSENSTRVAIVVDELGPGQFDLYVDRNRNRIIQSNELVVGSGRQRTLELAVEIAGELGTKREPRSVMFRRSITGRTIGVATLGHVTGSVVLDGPRRVSVRRVDGDGNGLFSDSGDRIWLDLDTSGTWDPFLEQFPLCPVMQLSGQRFGLRADRLGHRMSIERIEGVGRILVELADPTANQSVQSLSGMLIGADGSAFAFERGQVVTVPVGRYTMGSVSIALADDSSSLPWNFVFSLYSKPESWREVGRDQQISLDPIGQLRLELKMERASTTCRPGQSLKIRPRLYTQDALLISASSRGETDRYTGSNHNPAILELRSPEGRVLAHSRSGFS